MEAIIAIVTLGKDKIQNKESEIKYLDIENFDESMTLYGYLAV